MFTFADYIAEIFTVGQKKNVDLDVAFDMFRADVKAGKPQPSNTGNSIPNFPFKEIKSEWEKLSLAEQTRAINDFNLYIHEHYNELCELFKELNETGGAK